MKRAKVSDVACPNCGFSDIAEADIIEGAALIQGVRADGSVEWAGETEVDWDSQRPKRKKMKFFCRACGRHTSDLRRWIKK